MRQPSRLTTARPQIPFDDFDTNAVGTLNLLEAARRHCPDSPFIHMSTNKVYGDAPNRIRPEGAAHALGIRRSGTSRTASPSPSRSTSPRIRCSAPPSWRPTCWCRSTAATSTCRPAVCAAGASPARTMPASSCTAFSATWSSATWKVRSTRSTDTRASRCATTSTPKTSPRSCTSSTQSPRRAEVYNLGGGKENSCSILEAIELAERVSGRRQRLHLRRAEPRRRSHLLLQRPAQDEGALSRLGHHEGPAADRVGDRAGMAAAIAESTAHEPGAGLRPALRESADA